MFIVSLDYIVPVEKIEEHLQAHRDLLNEGYANKSVAFAARKVPRTGGVILINVKTRAEVGA